jgi:hypothetical protein
MMFRAIKSQRPAIRPPPSITAGIRTLLFELRSSIRQMCGTARPINETGPAKAVVAAVRTLEIRALPKADKAGFGVKDDRLDLLAARSLSDL